MEASDVLDFIPAVLRALAGKAMDRPNLLMTTPFALVYTHSLT